MQQQLAAVGDLVESAVELLREHEPANGYFGGFSGGKDSVAIYRLAQIAEVRVDWHYHVTTIDPPQLVRFIRREFPDVVFDRPAKSFVELVRKKGLPTRRARWCCAELKEGHADGRSIVLGIRGSESARRAAAWSEVSWNRRARVRMILPLFRWRVEDVWGFLRSESLPVCELYSGFQRRLGCILCPMAGTAARAADAEAYPAMTRAVKEAGREYWERRKAAGADSRSYQFEDYEGFWRWWLSNRSLPRGPSDCERQISFFHDSMPVDVFDEDADLEAAEAAGESNELE